MALSDSAMVPSSSFEVISARASKSPIPILLKRSMILRTWMVRPPASAKPTAATKIAATPNVMPMIHIIFTSGRLTSSKLISEISAHVIPFGWVAVGSWTMIGDQELNTGTPR